MIAWLRWLFGLPQQYSDLQDKHLALLDRYAALQNRYEALQDQHLKCLQELIEWKETGAALQAEFAAWEGKMR